ncbi:Rhodanese-like domain-containing protein [Ampelomyces quisqualis]|uniref:Rhodanese-like domain-containing protein n=1 Tax=Ampelomyces quisqualis TaxID=50730 RepID=A0A6A5QFZ5_AMPQU|nr:Rhodanese-like domain-containing protein [Ampelomyces quisqualis]
MAPKPSFPASLLRTYTSILSQRTSQIQFQASRLLGFEFRSKSQDAWKQHIEGVTRGIERMTGSSARLRLIPIPVRTQAVLGQRRWHSTDFQQKVKAYAFEDILAMLETPASSSLLIDVREPHEFDKNSIPTAINIPITSQPEALLLDEEDFLDRFGFAKPPLNKEVVFFCKAGVRSRAAAEIARHAGYENVAEYRGSFLDWECRGGPGSKSPPEVDGKGEPQLPV